jgi:hypothetical protein
MVLAGETDVLGENLPRRHFIHHKSHLPDPGANLSHLGGRSATNRFSYGVGFPSFIHTLKYLLYIWSPSILLQIVREDYFSGGKAVGA